MERLAAGETILCAEGYLLALARMGYIAHGVWVPEFILEQPEVLKMVHRMFVHSGTDVTEAFQVSCKWHWSLFLEWLLICSRSDRFWGRLSVGLGLLVCCFDCCSVDVY